LTKRGKVGKEINYGERESGVEEDRE